MVLVLEETASSTRTANAEYEYEYEKDRENIDCGSESLELRNFKTRNGGQSYSPPFRIAQYFSFAF
jgi:hypothetical protein